MKRLSDAFLLNPPGVISLVGAGGKTTLMFRLAGMLSAAGRSVLTTTSTKIFPPRSNQSSHLIVAADPQEILNKAAKILPAVRHITAARAFLADRGKLDGFTAATIDTHRPQPNFRLDPGGGRRCPALSVEGTGNPMNRSLPKARVVVSLWWGWMPWANPWMRVGCFARNCTPV